MLVVGDLTLDEDSHEVHRAGDEISLTATEFELLRFLMRNPRRVLSKAQILDRVWQYDFGGQANVVELYISYLRKKIDAGREPMIHTMRGAGYVLKPARDAARRASVPLTLTARLVAVVVLLVAVTARVIGTATTLAMRDYLTDRLDDEVRGSLSRALDRRRTSAARDRAATTAATGRPAHRHADGASSPDVGHDGGTGRSSEDESGAGTDERRAARPTLLDAARGPPDRRRGARGRPPRPGHLPGRSPTSSTAGGSVAGLPDRARSTRRSTWPAGAAGRRCSAVARGRRRRHRSSYAASWRRCARSPAPPTGSPSSRWPRARSR